jgi:hypothetical protein
MPEQLPLPDLEPVTSIPAPKYDYYLAVVHEGIVYQTLNVDGQTAALYASQPKFVQMSPGEAQIGYVYDEATNTFSVPE